MKTLNNKDLKDKGTQCPQSSAVNSNLETLYYSEWEIIRCKNKTRFLYFYSKKKIVCTEIKMKIAPKTNIM